VSLVVVLAIAFFAVLSARGAVTSGATLKTRTTKLGKIVVTASGRSLYLFEKDKHHKSACYGPCAKQWPPLLTKGKPVAGAGVKAKLLGVTMRKNGKHQVTATSTWTIDWQGGGAGGQLTEIRQTNVQVAIGELQVVR